MRVLVAMSGGVDSSVAAALLKREGHDVTGATMKLWGGESDTGCCSVADVDDARRVSQQLGIAHHVFNFSDDFERNVVDPYVADHAGGRTPNPCVECNRHLKFHRFLDRAVQLGFDAVATGHHARSVRDSAGHWLLMRGADAAKDQSYVLHMLGQEQLSRTLFPIGSLTKAKVRELAEAMSLRTASKADSQDVCFISRAAGREAFLGARIPLRDATLVDRSGATLGSFAGFELLTVGQRRGIGHLRTAGGERVYVVDRDHRNAVATVGPLEALMVGEVELGPMSWVDAAPPPGAEVHVQMSAHGRPVPGTWNPAGSIAFDEPVRRVAPGQSVVLYGGDNVLGGGPAL